MFEGDDSQSLKILVFGIPIDAEYREIARLWYGDVRTSIQYGHKDLTPADRARTEVVNALADELRRQGVPHPIAAAWDLVGTPDPAVFPQKLQPGQPLGDLTSQAVLTQFRPLILSRLKRFRVAGNEDARAAAELGLLNALAAYDPAVDASVGWYAKAYFLIDNEIKCAIRGKESDAWNRPRISGDKEIAIRGEDGDDENNLWDVTAKAALSDRTAAIIEGAHDEKGRLQGSRLAGPYHYSYPIVLSFRDVSIIVPRKTVFATALWITDTNPPWKKPFVARRAWPMPPAPRTLPFCAPKHPPDPASVFRHRRVLEDIRQWPLLDECTLTVHNTRMESNPDNFFG